MPTIITFAVVLLSLVTVHEVGHFIAAKYFGVYCEEFAIGFGPKIWSKKGKETEYSIRLLPLGGYVAMVGEDGGTVSEHLKDLPHERTLKGIARWKQLIVLFAGAFMNLLFAIVLFIGISLTTPMPNPNPVIGTVTSNSPAAQAGLQVNDRVQKITVSGTDYKVSSFKEVQSALSNMKTPDPIFVEVLRNKDTVMLEITPKLDQTTKTYKIGISQEYKKLGLVDGIKNGFILTQNSYNNIMSSLKGLFSGEIGLDQLAGPVGIFQITDQAQEQGGTAGIVMFAAFLSLNLAIFNLLPLPALDGGRMVMVAYEMIVRRGIKPKVEEALIMVSYVLLFGLVIYATFNDFLRF